MEKFSKAISISLLVIGFLSIGLGIFVGVTQYDKDTARDYKISERVLDELYDNPFAHEQYESARSGQIANVAFSIIYVASGVISGVLFIALGCIIDLLIIIKNK